MSNQQKPRKIAPTGQPPFIPARNINSSWDIPHKQVNIQSNNTS